MADRPSRLLVVEDEKNVGSTLVERLQKEGFDVVWAKTKEEALMEIGQRKFDLTLMDVGLPDGSGFDVAEQLKALQPSAAIIFLTAFNTPEDRIHGLELGAEDYIVKPFHLKELLLRVKNGLRRARYVGGGVDDSATGTQIGRATIYLSKFQAKVGNEVHSLTHKEASVLKLLIERKGLVVSRDEILNHVWSEDEYPSSRTIDNFILRLRKLIETDPENPQIIKSIRGVGYQLNV